MHSCSGTDANLSLDCLVAKHQKRPSKKKSVLKMWQCSVFHHELFSEQNHLSCLCHCACFESRIDSVSERIWHLRRRKTAGSLVNGHPHTAISWPGRSTQRAPLSSLHSRPAKRVVMVVAELFLSLQLHLFLYSGSSHGSFAASQFPAARS